MADSRTLDDLPNLTSVEDEDVLHIRQDGIDYKIAKSVLIGGVSTIPTMLEDGEQSFALQGDAWTGYVLKAEAALFIGSSVIGIGSEDGSQVSIRLDGSASFAGTVTASSFDGDGSSISNVSASTAEVLVNESITVVDANNSSLISDANNVTLNWDEGITYDSTEVSSINWFTRILYGPAAQEYLKWSGTGGVYIFALSDGNDIISLDTDNRFLYDSSGSTKLLEYSGTNTEGASIYYFDASNSYLLTGSGAALSDIGFASSAGTAESLTSSDATASYDGTSWIFNKGIQAVKFIGDGSELTNVAATTYILYNNALTEPRVDGDQMFLLNGAETVLDWGAKILVGTGGISVFDWSGTNESTAPTWVDASNGWRLSGTGAGLTEIGYADSAGYAESLIDESSSISYNGVDTWEVTGNVSASLFFGDGSALTNITVSAEDVDGLGTAAFSDIEDFAAVEDLTTINDAISDLENGVITIDTGWATNGDPGDKTYSIPDQIGITAALTGLEGDTSGLDTLLQGIANKLKALQNALKNKQLPDA